MKTKIKLHGRLSKIFKEEFEFFNIKKPSDCVAAITANYPKFKKQIMDDQNKGIHYEILVNGKTLKEKEEFLCTTKCDTIEIVPIIFGFGFVAVGLGTAMAVAGAYGIGGAVVSAFLFTFGVGLAMAGITYLMSAPEKIDPVDQEASVKGNSYYFSAQSNTATQGTSIPLGYGQFLLGSRVVGNTVVNLPVDQEPQERNQSGRGTKKGGNKAITFTRDFALAMISP